MAAISFTVSGSLAMEQRWDLPEIQKAGVIRHLGIPYANFVTGDGRGLDVEVIKLFASHIGVSYTYVPATWASVISDLIGRKYHVSGGDVVLEGEVPIKGDVIANGLTILGWRKKLVNYSAPTFPTQVWLITGAESALRPISPTGTLEEDITRVKHLLQNRTVLGISGTCLDQSLYNLEEAQAITKNFTGSLNELAPAVLNGVAETSLLDVPDSLVALNKWPGQIKILGPVSKQQEMGVGFRQNAPLLQQRFNEFFQKIKSDGTYLELVKKYYPDVFDYYPEFFAQK